MKAKFCYSILFFQFAPLIGVCQSIHDSILQDFLNWDKQWQSNLHFDFKYVDTDTLTLFELNFYYFSESRDASRCFNHKIALGNFNFKDRSLLTYLKKSGFEYFYLPNSSITLFSTADFYPDTAYYFSNKRLYIRNNFDIPRSNRFLYFINENEQFSLSKVTVIVDKFETKKIEYGKYLFHFLEDKDFLNQTKLTYYYYRRVLKREEVIRRSIFGHKRKKYSNFKCQTIYK